MRQAIYRGLRSLVAPFLARAGFQPVARSAPIPKGFERCGVCPLVFKLRNVDVHRFLDHGVPLPANVNRPPSSSAALDRSLVENCIEETELENRLVRQQLLGRGL